MTTATVDESKYIQRGIPVSNGKLAMWLFLVTEIMFFTGLIGTYIILRKSTPSGAWPEPRDVHLSELLGAINTFVLIFSSFTVVMAHSAISRGDSKKTVIYIAITFFCGVLFLGIKAYEYTAKFQHGIMPGRMADNLVDPALREIDTTLPAYQHFDPAQAEAKFKREHGERPPDPAQATAYDRQLESVRKSALKFKQAIESSGRHPYDPNVAEWYKRDTKNRLVEAIAPLLDRLKPAEESAGNKIKAAEEELKKADPKAALSRERRREIVEKERAPILAAASEKERQCFELYDQLTSTDLLRPITALEVGVEAKELSEKFEDLHLRPYIPYGNLWSSSYFAMTGFHAVHVLGGIVVFGIILLHGLRGKLVKNPWNVSMLELTGLYWHFVDVVWIFLFPLLYLV